MGLGLVLFSELTSNFICLETYTEQTRNMICTATYVAAMLHTGYFTVYVP